jgi:transcriptional regulator
MLAGIVGLELEVLKWACKLKINQHRPEAHARMREIYAAGNETNAGWLAWMQRLGLERK